MTPPYFPTETDASAQSWATHTRTTTTIRPKPTALPTLDPPPAASTIATSSSVSSPSAPDSDCAAEVDELLEGIDRVRIDDLWTTPRAAPPHSHAHLAAPFRAGLFAPPEPAGAIAAIAPAEPPCAQHVHARNAAVVASLSRSKSLTAAAFVSSADAAVDASVRAPEDHDQFPRMFKVHPCQTRDICLARGDAAECFYYHSQDTDRRRANVSAYKPHMCRFVEEAGGCRKGERCPFSHNDFERRYHPDRFGKETCRDFLRGDCPRRYCTFRHEVSGKVEVALAQMDAMNDKELLQLVLKISEPRGRALSEKLLRRFGHGKKHSGWRLEGFNPHGRDDQKVKFVGARIEEVKRSLRAAGEKKWAATLKTSSLRDMMSGVRKVAEEMRERCRAEDGYVENGSEVHRLIRAVFSNTNWSCHSQEGDNPFLVTPENQNDAATALERLVEHMLAGGARVGGAGAQQRKRTGMQTLRDVKGGEATQSAVVGSRLPLSDMGSQQNQNVGDGATRAEVSTLWAYPSSVGC